MAPSKNVKVGPQKSPPATPQPQTAPPARLPVTGTADASQPAVTTTLFKDNGIKKIA